MAKTKDKANLLAGIHSPEPKQKNEPLMDMVCARVCVCVLVLEERRKDNSVHFSQPTKPGPLILKPGPGE